MGDIHNNTCIYHLRRIGPRATLPDVANIMDFLKTVTLIGRSRLGEVDYIIDSSNRSRKLYISRLHARVLRQRNNQCKMMDDSLNGIFINNTKIEGSVILQEADLVTFGHPNGKNLPTGEKCRQPASEFQFIFERCTCSPEDTHGRQAQSSTSLLHLRRNSIGESIPRSYNTDIPMMVGRSRDSLVNSDCNGNELIPQVVDKEFLPSENNNTSFICSRNSSVSEVIPKTFDTVIPSGSETSHLNSDSNGNEMTHQADDRESPSMCPESNAYTENEDVQISSNKNVVASIQSTDVSSRVAESSTSNYSGEVTSNIEVKDIPCVTTELKEIMLYEASTGAEVQAIGSENSDVSPVDEKCGECEQISGPVLEVVTINQKSDIEQNTESKEVVEKFDMENVDMSEMFDDEMKDDNFANYDEALGGSIIQQTENTSDHIGQVGSLSNKEVLIPDEGKMDQFVVPTIQDKENDGLTVENEESSLPAADKTDLSQVLSCVEIEIGAERSLDESQNDRGSNDDKSDYEGLDDENDDDVAVVVEGLDDENDRSIVDSDENSLDDYDEDENYEGIFSDDEEIEIGGRLTDDEIEDVEIADENDDNLSNDDDAGNIRSVDDNLAEVDNVNMYAETMIEDIKGIEDDGFKQDEKEVIEEKLLVAKEDNTVEENKQDEMVFSHYDNDVRENKGNWINYEEKISSGLLFQENESSLREKNQEEGGQDEFKPCDEENEPDFIQNFKNDANKEKKEDENNRSNTEDEVENERKLSSDSETEDIETSLFDKNSKLEDSDNKACLNQDVDNDFIINKNEEVEDDEHISDDSETEDIRVSYYDSKQDENIVRNTNANLENVNNESDSSHHFEKENDENQENDIRRNNDNEIQDNDKMSDGNETEDSLSGIKNEELDVGNGNENGEICSNLSFQGGDQGEKHDGYIENEQSDDNERKSDVEIEEEFILQLDESKSEDNSCYNEQDENKIGVTLADGYKGACLSHSPEWGIRCNTNDEGKITSHETEHEKSDESLEDEDNESLEDEDNESLEDEDNESLEDEDNENCSSQNNDNWDFNEKLDVNEDVELSQDQSNMDSSIEKNRGWNGEDESESSFKSNDDIGTVIGNQHEYQEMKLDDDKDVIEENDVSLEGQEIRSHMGDAENSVGNIESNEMMPNREESDSAENAVNGDEDIENVLEGKISDGKEENIEEKVDKFDNVNNERTLDDMDEESINKNEDKETEDKNVAFHDDEKLKRVDIEEDNHVSDYIEKRLDEFKEEVIKKYENEETRSDNDEVDYERLNETKEEEIGEDKSLVKNDIERNLHSFNIEMSINEQTGDEEKRSHDNVEKGFKIRIDEKNIEEKRDDCLHEKNQYDNMGGQDEFNSEDGENEPDFSQTFKNDDNKEKIEAENNKSNTEDEVEDEKKLLNDSETEDIKTSLYNYEKVETKVNVQDNYNKACLNQGVDEKNKNDEVDDEQRSDDSDTENISQGFYDSKQNEIIVRKIDVNHETKLSHNFEKDNDENQEDDIRRNKDNEIQDNDGMSDDNEAEDSLSGIKHDKLHVVNENENGEIRSNVSLEDEYNGEKQDDYIESKQGDDNERKSDVELEEDKSEDKERSSCYNKQDENKIDVGLAGDDNKNSLSHSIVGDIVCLTDDEEQMPDDETRHIIMSLHNVKQDENFDKKTDIAIKDKDNEIDSCQNVEDRDLNKKPDDNKQNDDFTIDIEDKDNKIDSSQYFEDNKQDNELSGSLDNVNEEINVHLITNLKEETLNCNTAVNEDFELSQDQSNVDKSIEKTNGKNGEDESESSFNSNDDIETSNQNKYQEIEVTEDKDMSLENQDFRSDLEDAENIVTSIESVEMRPNREESDTEEKEDEDVENVLEDKSTEGKEIRSDLEEIIEEKVIEYHNENEERKLDDMDEEDIIDNEDEKTEDKNVAFYDDKKLNNKKVYIEEDDNHNTDNIEKKLEEFEERLDDIKEDIGEDKSLVDKVVKGNLDDLDVELSLNEQTKDEDKRSDDNVEGGFRKRIEERNIEEEHKEKDPAVKGDEDIEEKGDEYIEVKGDEYIEEKGDEYIEVKGDDDIEVKGDEYIKEKGDEYIEEKGNVDIDVEGDVDIEVKEDVDIEVKGNDDIEVKQDNDIEVKGDVDIEVKQDDDIEVKGDVDIEVKQDDDIEVKGDVDIEVKGDEYIKGKQDEDIEVEGKEDIEVVGKEDIEVEGEEYIEVKEDVDIEVKGDEDIEVKGDVDIEVKGDEDIEVKGDEDIEVKGDVDIEVKEDEDIEVKGDVDIEVKGNVDIEVKGDVDIEVKGDVDIEVQGDEDTEVKGNVDIEVKQDDDIEVKGDEYIEGKQDEDIEVKGKEDIEVSGEEYIEVKEDEDIEVEGKEDIEVDGEEYIEVKEDEDIEVKGDDDIEVKEDEYIEVKGDEYIEVKGDEYIEVQRDVDNKVKGDEDIEVKEDEDIEIKEDEDIEVKGDVDIEVKGDNDIEVKQDDDIEVKEDDNIEVKDDEDIEVKGDVDIEVEGDEYIEVKGHDDIEVKGDVDIEVQEDVDIEVKEDVDIEVKGDVDIEVQEDDHIEVKEDDDIKVKGDDNIEVQEDVDIEVKGDDDIEVKGDVDIEVQGDVDIEVKEDDDIEVKGDEDIEVKGDDDIEVKEDDDFEVKEDDDIEVKEDDDIEVKGDVDIEVKGEEYIVVEGEEYIIVEEYIEVKGDDDIEVKGDEDIEVKGKEDIEVKGDVDIEVKEDDDIEVKGDENIEVEGEEYIEVKEDDDIEVKEDDDIEVKEDEDIEVKGDKDIEVKGDEYIEVMGDEDIEVKGDEDIEVEEDEYIEVKEDDDIEVKGDDDIEVKKDEDIEVMGDEDIEVKGDEDIEVEEDEYDIEVKGDDDIEVKKDEDIEVKGDEDIEVKGDENIEVEGEECIEVKENDDIEVKGDEDIEVKGDEDIEVKGDEYIVGEKNEDIEVIEDDDIEVKGDEDIEIKGNDDIEVQGDVDIEVKEDVDIEVKGDEYIEVEGEEYIEVKKDEDIKVKEDEDIEVKGDENIEVKGNEDIEVKGDEDIEVEGEEYIEVKEDDDIEVKGDDDIEVKEYVDIEVKEDVDIEIKVDEDIEVKGDDDIEVKEDEYIEVEGKEDEDIEVKGVNNIEVKGDEYIEVKEDEDIEVKEVVDIEVKGDDDIEVKGDEYIDVKRNVAVEVKGVEHTEVKGEEHTEVKGDDHTEVKGNVDIEVKGDEHTEVKGDEHTEVKGDEHTEVKGDEHTEVKGNVDIEVKGDEHTEVKGDEHTEVTEDEHTEVKEGAEYIDVKGDEEIKGDDYEEKLDIDNNVDSVHGLEHGNVNGVPQEKADADNMNEWCLYLETKDEDIARSLDDVDVEAGLGNNDKIDDNYGHAEDESIETEEVENEEKDVIRCIDDEKNKERDVNVTDVSCSQNRSRVDEDTEEKVEIANYSEDIESNVDHNTINDNTEVLNDKEDSLENCIEDKIDEARLDYGKEEGNDKHLDETEKNKDNGSDNGIEQIDDVDTLDHDLNTCSYNIEQSKHSCEKETDDDLKIADDLNSKLEVDIDQQGMIDNEEGNDKNLQKSIDIVELSDTSKVEEIDNIRSVKKAMVDKNEANVYCQNIDDESRKEKSTIKSDQDTVVKETDQVVINSEEHTSDETFPEESQKQKLDDHGHLEEEMVDADQGDFNNKSMKEEIVDMKGGTECSKTLPTQAENESDISTEQNEEEPTLDEYNNVDYNNTKFGLNEMDQKVDGTILHVEEDIESSDSDGEDIVLSGIVAIPQLSQDLADEHEDAGHEMPCLSPQKNSRKTDKAKKYHELNNGIDNETKFMSSKLSLLEHSEMPPLSPKVNTIDEDEEHTKAETENEMLSHSDLELTDKTGNGTEIESSQKSINEDEHGRLHGCKDIYQNAIDSCQVFALEGRPRIQTESVQEVTSKDGKESGPHLLLINEVDIPSQEYADGYDKEINSKAVNGSEDEIVIRSSQECKNDIEHQAQECMSKFKPKNLTHSSQEVTVEADDVHIPQSQDGVTLEDDHGHVSQSSCYISHEIEHELVPNLSQLQTTETPHGISSQSPEILTAKSDRDHEHKSFKETMLVVGGIYKSETFTKEVNSNSRKRKLPSDFENPDESAGKRTNFDSGLVHRMVSGFFRIWESVKQKIIEPKTLKKNLIRRIVERFFSHSDKMDQKGCIIKSDIPSNALEYEHNEIQVALDLLSKKSIKYLVVDNLNKSKDNELHCGFEKINVINQTISRPADNISSISFQTETPTSIQRSPIVEAHEYVLEVNESDGDEYRVSDNVQKQSQFEELMETAKDTNNLENLAITIEENELKLRPDSPEYELVIFGPEPQVDKLTDEIRAAKQIDKNLSQNIAEQKRWVLEQLSEYKDTECEDGSTHFTNTIECVPLSQETTRKTSYETSHKDTIEFIVENESLQYNFPEDKEGCKEFPTQKTVKNDKEFLDGSLLEEDTFENMYDSLDGGGSSEEERLCIDEDSIQTVASMDSDDTNLQMLHTKLDKGKAVLDKSGNENNGDTTCEADNETKDSNFTVAQIVYAKPDSEITVLEKQIIEKTDKVGSMSEMKDIGHECENSENDEKDLPDNNENVLSDNGEKSAFDDGKSLSDNLKENCLDTESKQNLIENGIDTDNDEQENERSTSGLDKNEGFPLLSSDDGTDGKGKLLCKEKEESIDSYLVFKFVKSEVSETDIEKMRNNSEFCVEEKRNHSTLTLPDFDSSPDNSFLNKSDTIGGFNKISPCAELCDDDSDSLPQVEFLKASPAKWPATVKHEVLGHDSGMESSNESQDIKQSNHFTPEKTSKREHFMSTNDDKSPARGGNKSGCTTPSKLKLKLKKPETNEESPRKKVLTKRKREVSPKKQPSPQKELKENDNTPKKRPYRKRRGDSRSPQTTLNANETSQDKRCVASRRINDSPKVKAGKENTSKKVKIEKVENRRLSDLIEIITDSESDIETEKLVTVKTKNGGVGKNGKNKPSLEILTTESSVTDDAKIETNLEKLSAIEKVRNNKPNKETQKTEKCVNVDQKSEPNLEILTTESSTTDDEKREPNLDILMTERNVIDEKSEPSLEILTAESSVTDDSYNQNDDSPVESNTFRQKDTKEKGKQNEVGSSQTSISDVDNVHSDDSVDKDNCFSQQSAVRLVRDDDSVDKDNCFSQQSAVRLVRDDDSVDKDNCFSQQSTATVLGDDESVDKDNGLSQQSTVTLVGGEPSSEGSELSVCYSNTVVPDSVTEDDNSFCLDDLPGLSNPTLTVAEFVAESKLTRGENLQGMKMNNDKSLKECTFEDIATDDEEGLDIDNIVNFLENETVCYGNIIEDQRSVSEESCTREELDDGELAMSQADRGGIEKNTKDFDEMEPGERETDQDLPDFSYNIDNVPTVGHETSTPKERESLIRLRNIQRELNLKTMKNRVLLENSNVSTPNLSTNKTFLYTEENFTGNVDESYITTRSKGTVDKKIDENMRNRIFANVPAELSLVNDKCHKKPESPEYNQENDGDNISGFGNQEDFQKVQNEQRFDALENEGFSPYHDHQQSDDLPLQSEEPLHEGESQEAADHQNEDGIETLAKYVAVPLHSVDGNESDYSDNDGTPLSLHFSQSNSLTMDFNDNEEEIDTELMNYCEKMDRGKDEKMSMDDEGDDTIEQEADNDENLLMNSTQGFVSTSHKFIQPEKFSQQETVYNSIQTGIPDEGVDILYERENTNVKAEQDSASSPEEVISKRKAKDLLEKLKAKKRKLELPRGTGVVTDGEHGPSSSRTPSNNQSSDLEMCRELIVKLMTTLSKEKDEKNHHRVEAWKKELKDLECKLSTPKFTVAVVGTTGAGKSSLMNAIIDQYNVLPTSGTQACTAVVVKIDSNDRNDQFEADIEFLSKEEWEHECQLLIKDLTNKDGKMKKAKPDPETDTGVAYLKMRAVYGKFESLESLQRPTNVTRHLGKTQTIKSRLPQDFRNQINKYIENTATKTGGQFWPIIKFVTIRIPRCSVCSAGVTLVDLPGVRDANAARDRIAKDYMKNCSVMLVVAEIHRACSSKTAKDLLGENFRRQLLMDGQYTNVAFVCTKNDVITPSELIRELELEKETDIIEKALKAMTQNVDRLTTEEKRLHKEVKNLTGEISVLSKDVEELDIYIKAIEELVETSDENQELKEVRSDHERKSSKLSQKKQNLDAKQGNLSSFASQKNQLEIEMIDKRKTINLICARARTAFAEKQIKKDYKDGIREMKRKANMTQEEIDEDEEEYESEEEDSGSELSSSCENIKVFCVSSSEYQKLKNRLTDDGPPMVFDSEDDTGIPAVRQFVHHIVQEKREEATKRLIKNLAVFVYDIQNYLTENGIVCKNERISVQSAVEDFKSRLMVEFNPILQNIQDDVTKEVHSKIETQLKKGVEVAVNSAVDTCNHWGSPVDRVNRGNSGLCFPTYQATVRRYGEYQSKASGDINFNEDLAKPLSTSISIVWCNFFSYELWTLLERYKLRILQSLKRFTDKLCVELKSISVSHTQLETTRRQLYVNAHNKLTEMVRNLKELVEVKQRDINRLFSPAVKENLNNSYKDCMNDNGAGIFKRMKHKLHTGVDTGRRTMFDEASDTLLRQLDDLMKEVIEEIRRVCQTLCDSLQVAFEPLWNSCEASKQLKSTLFEDITGIAVDVSGLCGRLGVQITRPVHTDSPVIQSPGIEPRLHSLSVHPVTQSSNLESSLPPLPVTRALELPSCTMVSSRSEIISPAIGHQPAISNAETVVCSSAGANSSHRQPPISASILLARGNQIMKERDTRLIHGNESLNFLMNSEVSRLEKDITTAHTPKTLVMKENQNGNCFKSSDSQFMPKKSLTVDVKQGRHGKIVCKKQEYANSQGVQSSNSSQAPIRGKNPVSKQVTCKKNIGSSRRNTVSDNHGQRYEAQSKSQGNLAATTSSSCGVDQHETEKTPSSHQTVSLSASSGVQFSQGHALQQSSIMSPRTNNIKAPNHNTEILGVQMCAPSTYTVSSTTPYTKDPGKKMSAPNTHTVSSTPLNTKAPGQKMYQTFTAKMPIGVKSNLPTEKGSNVKSYSQSADQITSSFRSVTSTSTPSSTTKSYSQSADQITSSFRSVTSTSTPSSTTSNVSRCAPVSSSSQTYKTPQSKVRKNAPFVSTTAPSWYVPVSTCTPTYQSSQSRVRTIAPFVSTTVPSSCVPVSTSTPSGQTSQSTVRKNVPLVTTPVSNQHQLMSASTNTSMHNKDTGYGSFLKDIKTSLQQSSASTRPMLRTRFPCQVSKANSGLLIHTNQTRTPSDISSSGHHITPQTSVFPRYQSSTVNTNPARLGPRMMSQRHQNSSSFVSTEKQNLLQGPQSNISGIAGQRSDMRQSQSFGSNVSTQNSKMCPSNGPAVPHRTIASEPKFTNQYQSLHEQVMKQNTCMSELKKNLWSPGKRTHDQMNAMKHQGGRDDISTVSEKQVEIKTEPSDNPAMPKRRKVRRVPDNQEIIMISDSDTD